MDKKNKSLQDIITNYQDIEMKLIESNGEISEGLEELLSINESELGEKLDGYEKFTRYLKGQIDYLKKMEEMYTKRRKILDNSIKKCKESMAAALTVTGKNNIKTREFNFALGKSQKWEVDQLLLNDEDKLKLIKDGLAENVFKLHLSEMKSLYKNNENIPDWVNINEKLFVRVS